MFTYEDKFENIAADYAKFNNHEIPGGLKVCLVTAFGRSQLNNYVFSECTKQVTVFSNSTPYFLCPMLVLNFHSLYYIEG